MVRDRSFFYKNGYDLTGANFVFGRYIYTPNTFFYMDLKERIHLTTGLYGVVQENFRTAYEYFDLRHPSDALDYSIDLFIEHAVEVFSYQRQLKIKLKVRADEYLRYYNGRFFLTSKKKVTDIIGPFCFADTIPADELIPIKPLSFIKYFANTYNGNWDRITVLQGIFSDKLVKVIVQDLCIMFSGVLKSEGTALRIDSTGALVQ